MKVYFRVPNFTGYGHDFDSWAEALAYVNEHWHSEFVRQSIEIRESDRTGDRPLKRYEIPNPARVTR